VIRTWFWQPARHHVRVADCPDLFDAFGIGEPVERTVNVGTVHSFAWSNIIRPFATAARYPQWSTYVLAPQRTANDAMRGAIRRVFKPNSDTRLVLSTIKRNLKLCLSEQEWNSTGPDVREAALEYERLLREEDSVDFDGVVAMAVHLVEDTHLFARCFTPAIPT
jgi:DNA helicase II / ATP-dependent DNA helicase PcrA